MAGSPNAATGGHHHCHDTVMMMMRIILPAVAHASGPVTHLDGFPYHHPSARPPSRTLNNWRPLAPWFLSAGFSEFLFSHVFPPATYSDPAGICRRFKFDCPDGAAKELPLFLNGVRRVRSKRKRKSSVQPAK